MIDNFTAHSANERTFLAWLRTGIAVIAFGFVIEKFNLFISALGNAAGDVGKNMPLDRLHGPLGRYEGFAFMVTGIVLIAVGYFRFIRDKKLIDALNEAGRPSTAAELIVASVLILLAGAYCIEVLVR
jgi:putative membrane protein